MSTITQTTRVLRFLRDNPGASVLDLSLGLHPFVANPRARISDARKDGHVIECRRRTDGYNGFWVVEAAQQSLGLTA